MQCVERTAHNRQRCWKAGKPEGATPASGEIMHRLWRCLLLAERVLSAAKRMRWKGHGFFSAAGRAPHIPRYLIRRGVAAAPPSPHRQRRCTISSEAGLAPSGSPATQTYIKSCTISPQGARRRLEKNQRAGQSRRAGHFFFRIRVIRRFPSPGARSALRRRWPR